MSDKKITELPLASSVSASDVSVLVNNGTDYQFAFASLLQLIGSSINVGASISFGTTLPQNTVGKNGDVFINTSNATFAQKISGAWAIVYTLPASGNTTDGTVLYGIGIPNSSTGTNNDTYINTGTGVFYKKTAGTWNQVFSMQTGPAGAPGTPGANGTNGTNGFSILNGTGNPSNLSTGVNGDFYINTTTYTLFGPKTGGVWDNGISLIGEGVPIGGTFGQILSKASDDNFDVEWSDRFTGLNDETITEALGFTPEDIDNKGVANGYASLDGTGKIPSSQLPSYVDDVIEVATFSSLPVTGETGKIYITLDTNYEYRWSGSTYFRLVASPGSTDALAEGSSNLYFTFDRARSASSATSPIFYNTATGVISSQPATSSQHGYLTSTDWSTFNGKQNTITLTTTGTTGVATLVGSTLNIPNYSSSTSGTQNYVSKFGTGGNSIGDSQIFDNGTMVGIGYTSDPTTGNKFAVNGTAHFQGGIVVKGMSYLDGNAQIRKTTTTTNTQFGFYMINAGGTAPGLAQAAGVLAESGTPWYASTELVFKYNPGPDVTANANKEGMRINKSGSILMGDGSAISADNWTTNGIKIIQPATTFTNTTSAASSTVASLYINALQAPTIAHTNTGVTVTNSATLFVAPPVAGTNTTLTQKYSIYASGPIRAQRAAFGFVDENVSFTLRVGGTSQFQGEIQPRRIRIFGDSAFTSLGTNGIKFSMDAEALQYGVASPETVAQAVGAAFNRITLNTVSGPVTAGYGATVYIDGALIAGTNTTFTNGSYSLYVNSGRSYFGGELRTVDHAYIGYSKILYSRNSTNTDDIPLISYGYNGINQVVLDPGQYNVRILGETTCNGMTSTKGLGAIHSSGSASSFNAAGQLSGSLTGSGSVYGFNSYVGIGEFNAVAQSDIMAFRAQPVTYSGSAGSVTNITGFYATFYGISGSATSISNYYGFLSDTLTVSGSTIIKTAGMALAQLSNGTHNTTLLVGTKTIPNGNWGIYASNQSLDNYLGSGIVVPSPNGTLWRLTPSNAGASVWTAI